MRTKPEIIEEVKSQLKEVVREQYIENWMKTPKKVFGNLTPLELIDRGEQDKIYDLIYDLAYGNFC